MTLDRDIAAAIRSIPDHPQPGILFRDITTLLLDGPLFRRCVDRFARGAADGGAGVVAGIEARGFVFAATTAYALSLGHILLRKPGKLPGHVLSAQYSLEYGDDWLEMHADAVANPQRAVLVDDLLATGGTAIAAIDILRRAGATVDRALFLVDLPDLGGRDRLRAIGVEPHALCSLPGY